MKKYEFNDPEILEELDKLRLFFHRKKFAPDTINVYCNYTGYFLEWEQTCLGFDPGTPE